MQLATINPNVITRTRKDGKIIGERIAFDGTLSASDIRKQLKDAGVKGRELTKQVNAALSGTSDVRWMKYEALTSVARSNGFVPDYADAAANGKGITVRLVAPNRTGQDATAAALKARDAELAAIKAQHEAIIKGLSAMGVNLDDLLKLPSLES